MVNLNSPSGRANSTRVPLVKALVPQGKFCQVVADVVNSNSAESGELEFIWGADELYQGASAESNGSPEEVLSNK